jgi:hypothetical protein
MTPTDQVRRMFAAFDSKDVSALAAFMTDDVRLRLGNAEPVQGKTAFVEAVNAFLASVAGFRHELLNIWSVIGCAHCAPVAVSSASGHQTNTSANDPTTARHP